MTNTNNNPIESNLNNDIKEDLDVGRALKLAAKNLCLESKIKEYEWENRGCRCEKCAEIRNAMKILLEACPKDPEYQNTSIHELKRTIMEKENREKNLERACHLKEKYLEGVNLLRRNIALDKKKVLDDMEKQVDHDRIKDLLKSVPDGCKTDDEKEVELKASSHLGNCHHSARCLI